MVDVIEGDFFTEGLSSYLLSITFDIVIIGAIYFFIILIFNTELFLITWSLLCQSIGATVQDFITMSLLFIIK